MYTMNRCTPPASSRLALAPAAPLDETLNAPLEAPLLRVLVTPKKVAVSEIFYWAAAIFSINLLAGLPLAAHAQGDVVLPVPEQVVNLGAEAGRQFPPNAQRGKLQVVQGSDVLIDGKPERLSPGARIRGPQNTLVMTGAIMGQELVVNFVRDAYGNLHQVWLLTALEAKQKMKRATPERSFFFSSESDKSKVDDGKTPFDQLPKFKQ
jgi:hypothetical protein